MNGVRSSVRYYIGCKLKMNGKVIEKCLHNGSRTKQMIRKQAKDTEQPPDSANTTVSRLSR